VRTCETIAYPWTFGNRSDTMTAPVPLKRGCDRIFG